MQLNDITECSNGNQVSLLWSHDNTEYEKTKWKPSAAHLQTPASIRQLNRAQVPHHLFLPGISQRDLSHVAGDQETWRTEMDTHNNN